MKSTKKIALPLMREHMPQNYTISLDGYFERDGVGLGYRRGENRMPNGFGPPQSMRGFEETYRNIIDYIVRITHRIWESPDVEYIGDTYAEDSEVFDDYGLQRGSQKIIDDTYHTTRAFSDIRLIADEVVWAGNDEIGYHTSHRTLIRGTNDGDSKYGPATGREVDVLVIANCVALENEIFLEHVLYNNSSLVTQLGHKLEDIATRMVASKPAGWPRSPEVWEALRSASSPPQALYMAQQINGFDVDRFVRDNWLRIWNDEEFELLERNYIADFRFAGTTDRAFSGAADYVRMVVQFRECFSDLRVQIDEVYWLGNFDEGILTSERWSATGIHTGAGDYGPATGAEVQIWGITQHRLVGGLIVQEWMLFNELDLMMQITAARS